MAENFKIRQGFSFEPQFLPSAVQVHGFIWVKWHIFGHDCPYLLDFAGPQFFCKSGKNTCDFFEGTRRVTGTPPPCPPHPSTWGPPSRSRPSSRPPGGHSSWQACTTDTKGKSIMNWIGLLKFSMVLAWKFYLKSMIDGEGDLVLFNVRSSSSQVECQMKGSSLRNAHVPSYHLDNPTAEKLLSQLRT